MARFHLILVIHAHQPVGNFDSVLEQSYQRAYLPFLEGLERHPGVRIALHYSGPLLEWIEKHHAPYFARLRKMVEQGQVELLGGGFYEPILVSIPHDDRAEQLRRMARYLEKRFGQRPKGVWLTERVWEPQLPSSFAPNGVDYTLVDDSHFRASGFQPGQLYGAYVAEDLGASVKLIPGLQALRYLIPFREVGETIEFLRTAAAEHPGGFAAMGDDLEKFGSWPKTYEHCYTNGWLERFFTALEANAEWLFVTPPGEYLAAHPPLGRADLPTASYTELMEWALPTPARDAFHAAMQNPAVPVEAQSFLRGAFWRMFLTKYPEANLLHKRMLRVSERIVQLEPARRRAAERRKLADARTHLLRAQCNDAYWHGIFGGLYAPHLRTELWRELIRADNLADEVEYGKDVPARSERLDFDADGQEEIWLTGARQSLLLKPTDGATVAILEDRRREVTLVNSLMRRRESYHRRLRGAAGDVSLGIASIHEQTLVKEPGLEQRLRYDRWPRHSFRLLLFDPARTYDDYQAVRLDECAAFAAGAYDVATATASRVELAADVPLMDVVPALDAPGARLRAVKTFRLASDGEGFRVTCDVRLSHDAPAPVRLKAGIELIVNFLAPDEPDRFFESSGPERHPLNWGAAIPASTVRLHDGWQGIKAEVEAPDAAQFWIAPVETVSESEEGFERVYQGSQILAVWPAEIPPAEPWAIRAALRISSAR